MDINEVLQVYKIAIIGSYIFTILISLLLPHMCDCLIEILKNYENNYFDNKNIIIPSIADKTAKNNVTFPVFLSYQPSIPFFCFGSFF